MSLYLPVNLKGHTAVAICQRCRMKVQYSSLRKDPNNQNWYCPECVDEYDPWRLPARAVEKIDLDHPRKDEDLV